MATIDTEKIVIGDSTLNLIDEGGRELIATLTESLDDFEADTITTAQIDALFTSE